MNSTIIEIPEEHHNDCTLWLWFDGEGSGDYSLRVGESQDPRNYFVHKCPVSSGDRMAINLGAFNETVTIETTDNLNVLVSFTGVDGYDNRQPVGN